MIAFIHLGKTAGSTFKNVLRRSFGLHHCDAVAANSDRVFRDSDLKLAKNVYFGLWSLCSHHFQDPVHTLSMPLDYVTFIRDPLQRTASHYQHLQRERDIERKGTPPDFEEWLYTEASNFQIKQISGGADIGAALRIVHERFFFVGLTEQYAESLEVFSALSPWPVYKQVEKKNVAPDASVKKRLLNDPGTRRMMEEANAADIELYEKVRAEIFPAQAEKARAMSPDQSPGKPRDRYLESRLFTNLAYRPAVKLQRALLANKES